MSIHYMGDSHGNPASAGDEPVAFSFSHVMLVPMGRYEHYPEHARNVAIEAYVPHSNMHPDAKLYALPYASLFRVSPVRILQKGSRTLDLKEN